MQSIRRRLARSQGVRYALPGSSWRWADGYTKINSGMGKPGPQAKFHTTVYIRYSDCALATYK